MKGLQHLTALDFDLRRAQHPTMLLPYIPKSVFSDKNRDELTRCIVQWFRTNGHPCTSVQNEGTFSEDIETVALSPEPDVLANVNCRLVGVILVSGNDQNANQKQLIANMNARGVMVYVAKIDFEGFYQWYCAHFDAHKPHPIPRLATPDLPRSSARYQAQRSTNP